MKTHSSDSRVPWLLPGDYIAIVFALALVLGSFITLWGGWQRAALAEINVNGKHWRNVELFEDQLIHVHGILGDSILEVKNGRIRFIASPCTQKICIQQGWIKRGGASATCLPNRVSVTILSDDPDYDTMNF